ncbi:MAG: hypothetical protein Q7J34_03915 [Bacteroidales bacterium]|jgi:hypothetical protein|nr:hypothetical protein [Bacteroidales bacterium]
MEIDPSDIPLTSSEIRKRPLALTWLCVLSFIGSGLSCTAYFFYAVSYNEILSMIADGTLEYPGLELIMGAGQRFFVIGAILAFFSWLGVSFMWRLKIVGIHIYTAAQLLMVALYSVTIKGYQYVLFDFLLAGIFILLYWRFRAVME